MTSIAFEMGAVFLLAGMLMFGSAHGLIPRSVRNIGAPILVCIALFGFLMWRFGADLMANARANAAPWFATSASSQPAPAQPAPASPSHAAKVAPPAVKGIVIREVVSAPAEPGPAAVQPVAAKAIPDMPTPKIPIEEADAKPAPQSSGNSPYDSGVKRAVTSVGHFLHIGGKKQSQAPQ
jgi:hypothetical protein